MSTCPIEISSSDDEDVGPKDLGRPYLDQFLDADGLSLLLETGVKAPPCAHESVQRFTLESVRTTKVTESAAAGAGASSSHAVRTVHMSEEIVATFKDGNATKSGPKSRKKWRFHVQRGERGQDPREQLHWVHDATQAKTIVVNLFCGSQSLARLLPYIGKNVSYVGIDKCRFCDEALLPYFVADVLDLDASDLREIILYAMGFRSWTELVKDHRIVHWGGFPCEKFSRMKTNPPPTHEELESADKLVLHMSDIVFDPETARAISLHVFENPASSLVWGRDCMLSLISKHAMRVVTVSYCQYGELYEKPTNLAQSVDLADSFKPRRCPGGGGTNGCHAMVPNWGMTLNSWVHLRNVQDLGNAYDRARVPQTLAAQVISTAVSVMERKFGQTPKSSGNRFR